MLQNITRSVCNSWAFAFVFFSSSSQRLAVYRPAVPNCGTVETSLQWLFVEIWHVWSLCLQVDPTMCQKRAFGDNGARKNYHPARANNLFQNCSQGNLDVVALHLVRIGILSLAANNIVWTEEYLINKHNTLPHTLYEHFLEQFACDTINTFKLLGVFVSSDLSWDYHVMYILRKVA